jgi:ketosteroid isomerase-like protein
MQSNTTHPNATLLSQAYSAFTENNFDKMFSILGDQVTFQVSGKSALAGKFTKTNFAEGFVKKAQTLSGNTYQFSVHDILASDLHGTVLGTFKVTTHGKTTELRTVHVWRFENGKPVAGYEYTRDLYQFDQIFNS